MSHVTVFSPRREAVAMAAMRRHNARLSATVAGYTQALITAVSLHRSSAAERVRLELWEWCRAELHDHAEAEERDLLSRAADEADGDRVAVTLRGEHETLERLVDELGVAEDGVQAVAAASAIRAVLEGHLARENEQLLPLLARSPYVSLADLVGGTDALVGPLPEQPAAV
jgi:hypothetical protein